MKISVGAQAVNELLGGGIESRCITEIYGEFRSATPSHPCGPALACTCWKNMADPEDVA